MIDKTTPSVPCIECWPDGGAVRGLLHAEKVQTRSQSTARADSRIIVSEPATPDGGRFWVTMPTSELQGLTEYSKGYCQ